MWQASRGDGVIAGMGWVARLFSLKGRIGRLQLLAIYLCTGSAGLLAEDALVHFAQQGRWIGSHPVLENPYFGDGDSAIFVASYYIVAALVLWPLVAAMVKRLHDVDISGKWLVLFAALFALYALAIYYFAETAFREFSPIAIAALTIIGIPCCLLGFWLFGSMVLVGSWKSRNFDPHSLPSSWAAMKPIVIAVDGTAASGKGTLAKRLAAHFGFAHLDSGSLYRLVALTVIESGGDPSDEADAVKAARAIDPARRNDPAIRSEEVGRAASKVAVFPAVREALHQFQLEFIARPPGDAPGSVVDGRDIGTVIAPEATAKLFVDAKPEVRAHRRWLELNARGIERDEAAILAEIVARDAADMSRAVSPLKRADDAALLDTSDLDIDGAFAKALELVNMKVEAARAARGGR